MDASPSASRPRGPWPTCSRHRGRRCRPPRTSSSASGSSAALAREHASGRSRQAPASYRLWTAPLVCAACGLQLRFFGPGRGRIKDLTRPKLERIDRAVFALLHLHQDRPHQLVLAGRCEPDAAVGHDQLVGGNVGCRKCVRIFSGSVEPARLIASNRVMAAVKLRAGTSERSRPFECFLKMALILGRSGMRLSRSALYGERVIAPSASLPMVLMKVGSVNPAFCATMSFGL